MASKKLLDIGRKICEKLQVMMAEQGKNQRYHLTNTCDMYYTKQAFNTFNGGIILI